MICMICVDDDNCMVFNRRRQSQDKQLRDYILQIKSLSACNLWMNSYTKMQLEEIETSQIIVDETFLEKNTENDYYFVENTDITPYIDKIDKIILFKWNRLYPADTFFLLDFVGHSHDKITKEIYRK